LGIERQLQLNFDHAFGMYNDAGVNPFFPLPFAQAEGLKLRYTQVVVRRRNTLLADETCRERFPTLIPF